MVAEINETAEAFEMTSPCVYPVPVGLEKNYIPDENMWTTSEINSLRGAKFARLRGWKGIHALLLLFSSFNTIRAGHCCRASC